MWECGNWVYIAHAFSSLWIFCTRFEVGVFLSAFAHNPSFQQRLFIVVLAVIAAASVAAPIVTVVRLLIYFKKRKH
jgi:diacylglycerol kinase